MHNVCKNTNPEMLKRLIDANIVDQDMLKIVDGDVSIDLRCYMR